jgi:hypothetical protein
MQTWIWVILVMVVIAVLLSLAMAGMRGRRRAPFETRMFPANYVGPYARRIEEIERMFVSQPREAVAAAKLLVDDMLTRQGYPARMSADERVRDLRHFGKERANRYRTASALKNDANTEDLRRALQRYLGMAGDMLGDARKEYPDVPAVEDVNQGREIAG